MTLKYNNADLKTIHSTNVFNLIKTGASPNCVLAKNWHSVLTPSAPLHNKIIKTFTTVYKDTVAAATAKIIDCHSALIENLNEGHEIVLDVFETYLS